MTLIGRPNNGTISKEYLHIMNRTLSLISALGVGLAAATGVAQTTQPQADPAPATAAPAATATPSAPPQAIPAKIAIISFEGAVFATNEGQRAMQDIQAKFKPKKDQIDAQAKEVDDLKKQLQSAPTTLTDADRAARMKSIDDKEKKLSRDADDAQNAYQAEMQEAYGKIAQKFSGVLKNFVQQNGFTLLLDVSNQQTNNVMWVNPQVNIDITEAVVKAYNASSGIGAAPAAPSATARPRTTTPSTTPRTTTPKPTAPKQ
jgi:Skp family chaperone for outer membrane proteins